MLQLHNSTVHVQPDPTDNWTVESDTLTELSEALCRSYGEEKLVAFDDQDERVEVGLDGFVVGAYPAQVLDVVEMAYNQMPSGEQLVLQGEINALLADEQVGWRLADGQFFRVDSEFLSLQVVARSYELLKAEGYEGALDEFNEARNDLTAGDHKGAIHNACKSMESVLKAYHEVDGGTAADLIRSLPETEFYGDMPDAVKKSFGDQVLLSLPYLRNRLGGHGQGDEKVEVPQAYAELAVHLAASFNYFLIQRFLQINPVKQRTRVDHTGFDDTPF